MLARSAAALAIVGEVTRLSVAVALECLDLLWLVPRATASQSSTLGRRQDVTTKGPVS
jgi:hypothetical protein